jgi:hypothetical protein
MKLQRCNLVQHSRARLYRWNVSHGDKKNWKAPCSGISPTAKANQSEMPNEYTENGAWSDEARTRYLRLGRPTEPA